MAVIPSTRFVQAIERATGLSVTELRNTPIAESRRKTEQRLGRKLRFVSHFPYIGRGSILHGELIGHEEVEDAVSEALK